MSVNRDTSKINKTVSIKLSPANEKRSFVFLLQQS